MRWVWIASAGVPAGDGALRPCLLAARVLPPSWGEWVAGGPVGEGLAPVNLAGGAGSHRLLCVLVAVALAVCAARIAAGILARLLRARRERRVVRAWAGSRGAPVRASGRAPECAPGEASGRVSGEASGEVSGRASGEVPGRASGRGETSPRPRARFAALSRCAVLSRCASSTRRGEAVHRDLPQRANSPSWPPRSPRDCAPAPRPRPRGSEPWNASGWAARSGPTTFIRAPSTSGHASRRGGAPS